MLFFSKSPFAFIFRCYIVWFFQEYSLVYAPFLEFVFQKNLNKWLAGGI